MAPTHSKPVGDDNEDRKKRARQHPVFDLFDSPSSKLERGAAVFKDDVVAALAAGKSLDNLSLAEMIEPAETPPKVASKPIYDFKDEDSAKKGLAANPDGYEEWLKMNVGEVESPPPQLDPAQSADVFLAFLITRTRRNMDRQLWRHTTLRHSQVLMWKSKISIFNYTRCMPMHLDISRKERNFLSVLLTLSGRTFLPMRASVLVSKLATALIMIIFLIEHTKLKCLLLEE